MGFTGCRHVFLCLKPHDGRQTTPPPHLDTGWEQARQGMSDSLPQTFKQRAAACSPVPTSRPYYMGLYKFITLVAYSRSAPLTVPVLPFLSAPATAIAAKQMENREVALSCGLYIPLETQHCRLVHHSFLCPPMSHSGPPPQQVTSPEPFPTPASQTPALLLLHPCTFRCALTINGKLDH